ncbi:MAG: T9SS type A sorting domain-containing protein [Brumimicrobium sp.]
MRAILIFTLTFCTSVALSQKIERSSINAFGNVTSTDQLKLSQSVGQAALTKKFFSKKLVLRQGFQQPKNLNNISGGNAIDISVFPNPSDGTFQLNFEGIRNVDFEYWIMDNQGRVCFTSKGTNGGASTINMNDNSQSGSYTLKVITSNEEVGVARLIVL